MYEESAIYKDSLSQRGKLSLIDAVSVVIDTREFVSVVIICGLVQLVRCDHLCTSYNSASIHVEVLLLLVLLWTHSQFLLLGLLL